MSQHSYLRMEAVSLILSLYQVIYLIKISRKISWEYDVKLFTGAPQRGHVPVQLHFYKILTKITIKLRPWLEEVDWKRRTDTLDLLCENTSELDDADGTWQKLTGMMLEATRQHIPIKKTCRHSKSCGLMHSPLKAWMSEDVGDYLDKPRTIQM